MGIKNRSFPDKMTDVAPAGGKALKDIETAGITDPVAKDAIKDIVKFLRGKFK
jgi:hypothetical protein